MEDKTKKLLNLVFDNTYNLKYQGRISNLLKAKIEIFLDDLEKEALSYNYDFRLNDKQQKFKLKKIERRK